MNIVKEQILNSLTMKDILNKYEIKTKNNNMFQCPFHKDERPSAKCYNNSFYCFSCNRSGDFIQFVKFLYQLNFQEAMDKIIDDFQLGLKSRGNYDKSKILEMQRQEELKKMKEEKEKSDFRKLCARKDLYSNIISDWKDKTDLSNWEDMTLAVAYMQDRVEILDMYICDRYNIPN